jgi:hypothetical protein
MNPMIRKRLQRLEQSAESALPWIPPITAVADSHADADRKAAELEASGALVSPDGRRIPLISWVKVTPPSYPG